MPNNTTRWTVSVSKRTDLTVRSFLAQRGMKKGDMSKFIEDAVKWRVLEQTLAEARDQFSDLSPETLDSLIDEAVSATRQSHIDSHAGSHAGRADRGLRLVADRRP